MVIPNKCGAQLLNSPWPGFRHDSYQRGQTSAPGPAAGSNYNKIHIGGSGLSTVAIGDGRAYAVGDSKLYAISTDGSIIWTYQIGDAGWSSPAIDSDGVVYVASYDGVLYAINSDGTLSWNYNMKSTTYASPSIGPDGTVYIGCSSGKFYAFRKGSSTPSLTYTAGGAIRSSASVGSDGSVYFGCDDGKLYALSSSFKQKWTTLFAATKAIRSSPAIGTDGTVYVGSMDGYFYAVRPADGGLKWRCLTGGAILSSPAIGTDGYAYVGCEGMQLYRITLTTGTGKNMLLTHGYIDSSPAFDANGTVYFGSYDSSLYAVDSSGLKWSVDLGAAIASSPTIGENGTLYVLTVAGDLYIFGSDATPPTQPIVNDDGLYSTSATTLHASWQSDDPESGINHYEYAIGTSAGAQDVLAFTNVGTATEITNTNLSLTNGKQYYFAVRATNNVGLVSDIGVSDGIKVDYTPPVTPIVVGDGLYTTASDKLHVMFNSGDPESGIAYYEISAGDAVGSTDVCSWKNVGLSKDQIITGLSLSNGKTYYINVRAYNKAGLMNSGHTSGITLDQTPPYISSLDVNASSQKITANVDAEDKESGINDVQYVFLTSTDIPSSASWSDSEPGGEITISGPFDAAKTYYVAVRAKNNAGLLCDPKLSSAINIDSTPPTVPTVTDDGDFQTNASDLNASWISSDPESGIKSYEYCVGISPNDESVIKWTTTTLTAVSLTGLSLANGGKYYFTVKAINGAGMISDSASSDGITVDTTAPSTPVVQDDGDQTAISNSLHAQWASSDNESGIEEYSYCVGTSRGSSDIISWKSSGQSNNVNINGLSLASGVAYYISVKAKNFAGLWSSVGSSDGIVYKESVISWSKFRCDSQNAGLALVDGPSTSHVAWSVQTNGAVQSSPAVYKDGTAYIGSSDGKLYAVTSGGQIKWTYQTGDCIDSSPAIDSLGNIYVGSNDKYMYCIAYDGSLKWRFFAGDMVWSSPLITSDGYVYFGCENGYFYALNSDGTMKWKYNTGSAVWSSPALDSLGNIYFGCGNGMVYSLNSSGTLKWEYQTGSAVDSSPAIDKNGTVYFGSGDGCIYAIDAGGNLKWRHDMGDISDASPAVAKDGTVYFGTGVAHSVGTLQAFSSDGSFLWKLDLPGGVRSSPAVGANGVIYVGCTDNKIYAVDPNGQKLWYYATSDSIMSSPAISGYGNVLIGSDDGCIYSFKDVSAADTQPPSQPVVTVSNKYVEANSALSASWISTDTGSGIQSYSYAIGTSAGASDVVGWTLAGLSTGVTKAGLPLQTGKSYYFSVIAKDYTGLMSSVGVSEPITVISDDVNSSIGTIKREAAGTSVNIQAKIVTAVYSDCVFVEDSNRSSGIRCVVSNSGLSVSDVVDVSGYIAQINNEIVISGATLQKTGTAQPILPLAVTCNSLVNIGLDLTGSLVRVCGKVMRVGDGYIVVYDGCNWMSPRGAMGMDISISGDTSTLPAVGTYVGVNGVVCIDVVSSRVTKEIRAANDPKLVIYRQISK